MNRIEIVVNKKENEENQKDNTIINFIIFNKI